MRELRRGKTLFQLIDRRQFDALVTKWEMDKWVTGLSTWELTCAFAAWVNLLVPGHFVDAEKLVSPKCQYAYKAGVLRGQSVVKAFIESHESASQELDSIEYLPGEPHKIGPDGVLVVVTDRISINGKSHLYKDRLLVKMELIGNQWQVVQLQHLPIAEGRSRLHEFLTSAGSKRT
jgi:hypothetical protein